MRKLGWLFAVVVVCYPVFGAVLFLPPSPARPPSFLPGHLLITDYDLITRKERILHPVPESEMIDIEAAKAYTDWALPYTHRLFECTIPADWGELYSFPDPNSENGKKALYH